MRSFLIGLVSFATTVTLIVATAAPEAARIV